ncbi:MAG: right-handed parallel beta-helix repeat-containing protein [Gemmobacter sp.]
MKRVFTPPRPHDHLSEPPEGGGGLRLISGELILPDGTLVLQNGIDAETPMGDPVTVDLTPLVNQVQLPDIDIRLSAATVDPDTRILTLQSVDKEGNAVLPDVSVDLTPIAGTGTGPGVGGGATISEQDVLVLAPGVTPTNINYGDLAFALVDDGDGTITVSLNATGDGNLRKLRRPIISKTSAFALSLADEGTALHVDSATDLVVTIPLNAAVAAPIGYEVEIVRIGSGAVTIDAVPGVTLNGVDGGLTTVTERYKSGILRKISTNGWLVVGAVAAVSLPVETTVFLWADVFADHTPNGGQNWTGWGTSQAQPAEAAIEWFMRNRVPALAPEGAILDLNSPTGTIYIMDRLQPPPTSVARNWVLDLTGNTIQRGKTTQNWGVLFMWGELVKDPALLSDAVVGANAAIGATTLVVGSGASSDAFLAAVQPGSVVEIRTNTTAPNYHPAESRTTVYVASKNVGTRTLTLHRPLDITVPQNNTVDSWESSDPSTLSLLVGSLLSVSAGAGANKISLVDASRFNVGDWVHISTSEVPKPGWHQLMDSQGAEDFTVVNNGSNFGTVEIQCNEELHQVIAKSGNTLTLAGNLGKNKLVRWNACAVKVDPIQGARVVGGQWRGFQSNSGADPWVHQYIWARYCVGCTFEGGEFDKFTTAEEPLNVRRMGQAIRLDSGDANLVKTTKVGPGGSIEAGFAYGISMRLGERNSTVRECEITGCRHSIELWSTSGGVIIEENLCLDDTSSSLDTHGSWNVGAIIRRNTVRRSSSALYSPDSGGSTDAIRIGNPKFLWDEDIQVIDNVVENYKGVAFVIVPGARRVIVDGLKVTNVERVVSISKNSRHPAMFSEDVVIRNVEADQIAGRICEISHSDDLTVIRGLVLKDWIIGRSGTGTTGTLETMNVRVLNAEDVTVDNVRLEAIVTEAGGYGFWFERVAGLKLIDIYQKGGERGISFRGVTNAKGTALIQGLTNSTPYLLRADTSGGAPTNSGTITIYHDQGGSPSSSPATITATLLTQ